MLIKVKFLRNGQPYGRDYTYRSEISVEVGDHVELPSGGDGIVTAVNVPELEVAAYADKVKKIIGLAKEEPEAEPKETYNAEKAELAQIEYCKKKGLPHFVPMSGVCFRCHQNIYLPGTRRATYGISVESAGRHHITGCPHCHQTFCD